jgi:hypothetical protein
MRAEFVRTLKEYVYGRARIGVSAAMSTRVHESRMTSPTTLAGAETRHADLVLRLSWSEAQRLRVVLPSLLRALADRPTTQPRQRERREEARDAIGHLFSELSSELERSELTPNNP